MNKGECLSWTALVDGYARGATQTFVHPRQIVAAQGGSANLSLHVSTVNELFAGLAVIHSDPPVFTIDDILTSAVCDRLIRQTLSGRGMSLGRSATHGGLSTVRSSSSWLLNNRDCPELISAAELLTGISSENFEAVQIIRYKHSEEYTLHLDHLASESRGAQGNRLATLLVYLNSPEVGGGGGETSFRDLNLEISPLKGLGLLFFPSFAGGEPDFRTSHSSRPVRADNTKWCAQIFMRQEAFSFAERSAMMSY
jgi:hypothetical protein